MSRQIWARDFGTFFVIPFQPRMIVPGTDGCELDAIGSWGRIFRLPGVFLVSHSLS